MKVTILTIGTLGDVLPYIALGVGLKKSGNFVTLATEESFRSLVERRGLQFAPLRAEYLNLLGTKENGAAIEGGMGKWGLMRKVMPMLRNVLDDSWQVAQGSDVIIYHPKTLGGSHIAEKLGVPGFLAHPVPMMSATKAFPSPFWPKSLEFGGHLNRASYAIMNLLMTLPYRGVVNAWRKEVLGLKPRPLLAGESVPGQKTIVRLYGCSPQVVPVPSDWDSTTVMTGYWFLEREPSWVPPADLQAFLESGPPPVYIGFGSMGNVISNERVQMAIDTLGRLDQRGVIALSADSKLRTMLPLSIFPIDNVPHDWLFPFMKAVVHHGGAGTTAAGLKAGKPTVILPFFGDQPFWGNRVHALGVGPKPIPKKKLAFESLTEAIDAAVSDSTMLQNAQTLGEKIQSEDGLARAVEKIMSRVSW